MSGTGKTQSESVNEVDTSLAVNPVEYLEGWMRTAKTAISTGIVTQELIDGWVTEVQQVNFSDDQKKTIEEVLNDAKFHVMYPRMSGVSASRIKNEDGTENVAYIFDMRIDGVRLAKIFQLAKVNDNLATMLNRIFTCTTVDQNLTLAAIQNVEEWVINLKVAAEKNPKARLLYDLWLKDNVVFLVKNDKAVSIPFGLSHTSFEAFSAKYRESTKLWNEALVALGRRVIGKVEVVTTELFSDL